MTTMSLMPSLLAMTAMLSPDQNPLGGYPEFIAPLLRVRYNPGGVNCLTEVDDLHEMIAAAYDAMFRYINDYKMTEP